VQHKVKREEAKAQVVANLKRENHQLKRAVKRLEKDLNKRVAVEEEVAEQGLQEEAMEKGVTAKRDDLCQKCGDDSLHLVTLLNRTYAICAGCGWRGKLT
jgi:hypothetical protein